MLERAQPYGVILKIAPLSEFDEQAARNYIFCGILDMKWTVETLNGVVDAELEALPADMRARLAHIANLIEQMGLERVGEPHVKHLEGRLWEMRLTGKSGISRALYVVATDRRVVIVRAFVKKTQKTPRREIDLAKARAQSLA
jgi:phage-related protein